MQVAPVRVECYDGYRADETPRRFSAGGRWIEVAAVLDRWVTPDHRFFRVRDVDGGESTLRHCPSDDHWELELRRP